MRHIDNFIAIPPNIECRTIALPAIKELIEATKELADLYECSYGHGDEHCHNEAWGVDHLTSCPKLVAEKAIEKVRKLI